MSILICDDDSIISMQDCIDYLGEYAQDFFERLETRHQRLGQAWFNSLSHEDQMKLTGTFFDPFYRDTWADVLRALEFLLTN